jgi:predicted RNA-binding Zn ribbon-like protein
LDPGGAALLAALARSAADTLTGDHATRLSRCAGTGCILLFVATQPRRSYCSAELCGTRTRVARHRERTRATNDRP